MPKIINIRDVEFKVPEGADLNVDVYPMAYRGPDGKEPQRRAIYHGDILWHGPYGNKLKFLRLVGRLPE